MGFKVAMPARDRCGATILDSAHVFEGPDLDIRVGGWMVRRCLLFQRVNLGR